MWHGDDEAARDRSGRGGPLGPGRRRRLQQRAGHPRGATPTGQAGRPLEYRHLQSLVEQGVADVIQSPDGEATYRYCGETTSAHHHHLVCRKCGHTEEVTARAIERWAAEIASKFDFWDVDHTVEIFGTCAPCRKTAEKSALKT